MTEPVASQPFVAEPAGPGPAGAGQPGSGREAESASLDDIQARCQWCRRPLPAAATTGRPRRYCRAACRQRAYEARRRSQALALGDDVVVVAKVQLDRLYDLLYALEAALDDVDADLAGVTSAAAYRQAFDHLYRSARPLRGAVLDPAVG